MGLIKRGVHALLVRKFSKLGSPVVAFGDIRPSKASTPSTRKPLTSENSPLWRFTKPICVSTKSNNRLPSPLLLRLCKVQWPPSPSSARPANTSVSTVSQTISDTDVRKTLTSAFEVSPIICFRQRSFRLRPFPKARNITRHIFSDTTCLFPINATLPLARNTTKGFRPLKYDF